MHDTEYLKFKMFLEKFKFMSRWWLLDSHQNFDVRYELKWGKWKKQMISFKNNKLR